ncbi:MAG TPA: Stp1/IreP family PP2C-type Ser/Thr phosphatase [Candidatus Pygmaiobacter gallistercoris]|nr:Stp1/IreP family PP2C-type Ser/Thr phosphatase [Candidatus Pygmaiobacter gallistercoris]
MKIVGRTDIGKRRSENQDNYRAGRQADDTVWAVVCDGMGGARGGAVASGIAVSVMEEELSQKLVPELGQDQIRRLLEQAVEHANGEIFDLACADPTKRGMGTTLVAMVVKRGTAQIIHAGDSRAYLYRAGKLIRLTRDHSMVQEMVEKGSLTPQEAEVHPNKNLITRAVGVNPKLRAEYSECTAEQGDTFLLCSDGLTNFTTEEELCEILGQEDFFTSADKMVQAALETGGQDNITAVLLKMESTEV